MADISAMRWFFALCPLLLGACNTHQPTAKCQRLRAAMNTAFERYDTNQDGRISRPEYHTVINSMTGLGGEQPQQDENDFSILDQDRDGYLSFEEFTKNMCGKEPDDHGSHVVAKG